MKDYECEVALITVKSSIQKIINTRCGIAFAKLKELHW